MGTVISNLKARFGVESSDLKKGLKEGEKAVDDFKGAAGSTLDQFASMFGVNMGAVNDAIGTAQKSLNFLGSSFTAASQGGNKLAVTMKVVKTALVSTGLGAIVVGLGSLIAYFSKTGEGADKFAKILAQIKSVINNTIERLAVFGKGLWEIMTGKFKQGWETMRGAFKGMGDELREDWKAAGDLADREDALDDKEIDLINSLEARRAKAAELRLAAREEIEDQHKKLDLVKQAEDLIKSVYADEIGIEKERLAIMKEKLAIASKDPTDEQRREVAEQEAKINSLLRAQAEELRSLTREKNAALKVVQEELELEELKSEQVAITKAEISGIKMPDFSAVLPNTLAPINAISDAIKDVTDDIAEMNKVVETTLEDVAGSFATTLGSMWGGAAGKRGWGVQLVGAAFGDMLIALGKVAIGVGITIEAIKESFKKLGGVGAIAAGVALIALGAAIKASIANIYDSKTSVSAGTTSGGGATYTYDTRVSSQKNSVGFPQEIRLRAEGRDLLAVLDLEKYLRNIST